MSRFFEFATREIHLEMVDSNTNQTGSKQDPDMNCLTQPYQAGPPPHSSASLTRWVLVSTPLRQVFRDMFYLFTNHHHCSAPNLPGGLHVLDEDHPGGAGALHLHCPPQHCSYHFVSPAHFISIREKIKLCHLFERINDNPPEQENLLRTSQEVSRQLER